MFDHNPFSIGVAGGFAREVARELGEQADLVVATVDGRHMFPKAEVVQIDTEPLGLQNGKTVLFEGDGSLLMHIQELEMVQRHGLKLLICVLNDGAYGSEVHKLRADGIDDSGSIFGRTDLASIAKGFGLRGTTVTDINQFKPLFEAYQAQGTAELWNIHVSDRVVSPSTRRGVGRGHGKM